jgi:hypothetical protein
MGGIQLRLINKAICLLVPVILLAFSSPVKAAETTGRSYVKAELSCYIHAMGGVEFGAPLLESATVDWDESGDCTVTLHLGKSQVEIYSIVCDTFVDVSPTVVDETAPIKNGTLGYYTEGGELTTERLSYTLSSDTAKNARDEDVHYVNSITFPADEEITTYYLSLYINSNVMGTQFSSETYPAVLTIDWSALSSDNSFSSDAAGGGEDADAAQELLPPDSMGGLNIYHAGNQSDIAAADATQGSQSTAPLPRPVLIISIVAASLVAAGTVAAIVIRKGRNP